jgi:NhaA family Na+:H+ antiporter
MAIEALEDACEKVQPLLHLLEHSLHPWVTFLIMPVFALANAGVSFGEGATGSFSQPVTIGVILGLLFGKPLGITIASWLAVKLRLASLPQGVNWRQIHAAAWLGGIGFTMSLFIAALALSSDNLLLQAKIGIFAGSLGGAVIGSLLMRMRSSE